MRDADTDDEKDWAGIFEGKFGSREGLDARLAAERKAGQTAKERARKGPKKTQVNFRATDETRAQIAALMKHHSKSSTDVIALAIQAFAEATLPKAGGKK